MKQFTIAQLASAINAYTLNHNADLTTPVTAISTDTRTLQPGDCFIAITGPTHDGHKHIQTAIDNNAACVIINKGVRHLFATDSPCTTPILAVDDTITALGQLAKWYRTYINAKLIAITGSAGKTSTRHILTHVLSKHFNCHQSPKSFNNNIGLPLTILSAQPDHDIIIAELGSNAPGEIAYLTDIAQPDIAVVTNIAPAHLEGFGSIENIIKEKSSIAQGLTKDGKFLINADHPDLVIHCQNLQLPFITFGTNPDADIAIPNIRTMGLTGTITIDDTTIDVPLPGRANLLNTIAAYAVSAHIGLTPEQFAQAITDIAPPDMRLNIISAGYFTIINDCYNANPASMRNALDCLRSIASDHNRRSVFIAGTMGELGPQSQQLHADLGANIAAEQVDLLLAVGKFADSTANAAKSAANATIETHIFENTDNLCKKLQLFVKPDDIILVKGSRSAKLERVTEQLIRITEEIKP